MLVLGIFMVLMSCCTLAQITLRSPRQDQVLYPGRIVRIEWEQSKSLPVDVRYSPNRGQSWHTISRNVLGTGVEWQVPELDTVPLTIQARLVALSTPTIVAQSTIQDECIAAHWLDGVAWTITRTGMLCKATPTQVTCRVLPQLTKPDIVALSVYPSASDSLIIASRESLLITDTQTAEVVEVIRTGSVILSMAVHPYLPIVITGCADGFVRIWDIPKRKLYAQVLSQALGGVDAVTFHPNGSVIAHGGADGVIIIEPWNNLGTSTERVYLLPGSSLESQHQIVAIAFSPDGKLLLSSTADSSLYIWNWTGWKLEKALRGLNAVQRAIAFSRDGSRLLTGGDDGSLQHWSMPDGVQLDQPLSAGCGIVSVGYHVTSDTFNVVTRAGTVQWWALTTTDVAMDTVRVIIRYPYGLVVGSCRGKVGDTVHIPILLDHRYRVPHFYHGRLTARCTLVLPPSLAVVGERLLYSPQYRRYMLDTITVPLDFGKSDTVCVVPLQVLAVPTSMGDIGVIIPVGVEWERRTDAFILEQVENGLVTIETSCPIYGQRIPVFTEIHDPFIAPNPATDIVELVFSAIESGIYSFVLQSLSRTDELLLFHGTYARGTQRVLLNLESVSSGAYTLVVRGPSTVTTVNLLVIR